MAMIGPLELIVVLVTSVLVVAGVVALIVVLFQLSRRQRQPSRRPSEPGTTVKLAACPRCGIPLPADAPQGLCPRCVMQVGLGTQDACGPAFKDASGKANPPDPSELARHFPQLEIIELLGQGGMGAVYKARQKDLDRFVALKVLPGGAGGDPAFAERFSREARALAKLSHPNIVGVHDFGQVGQASSLSSSRSAQPSNPAVGELDGETGKMPVLLYYFIMEFIDGPNLRQLMQSQKISPREAMTIVPKICEALQFAHDEGVVHRDIKPENILLDRKGRVKIADFGIAKIVGKTRDATITGAKDVIGTPHYMAPEQVEKPQQVDHRADIYSLGVVFYEMLTGELPLGKFEVPSHKVRVDVRLDEVVLHTLEKEPDRRYQHASEVRTDVETIAAGTAAPLQSLQTQSQAPSRESVQPIFAGLLLLGSFLFLALLCYCVHIHPLVVDRFAALDTQLPSGMMFLAQIGSLIGEYDLLLFSLAVLVILGSFAWWMQSSIRAGKRSVGATASNRTQVWALWKIWGFGIASLGFAFATIIWGAQALRCITRTHYWGPVVGGRYVVESPVGDAVIALLSLILAFSFGIASSRQRQAATGGRAGLQDHAAPAGTPRNVPVARWTARIFGTLLLLFYGTFIIAEGLPPIATQSAGVQLNFMALGLMLGGFAVGWKREGTAALLIASGWTLWHISEGRIDLNLFQTPLPVAALYAYCWWELRGRRTGVLAATVVTLALALGIGRLVLPVNVFVHGAVADALTGAAITNASLTIVQKGSIDRDPSELPNARTGTEGRFRLHLGWYAAQQLVAISAPGYVALTTNLGPRELGQRHVDRDFQLQAVGEAPITVGDVSGFGPVVNALLISPQGRTAELLDLDTGLRVTSTMFGENDRETHAWIRSNRLDVLGVVEKGHSALLCNDMAVIPVDSNLWATVTPEQVLTNWVLNQQEPKPVVAISPITDHTDTFFFRTREDGHGVLQLLAQSEDPLGVNIRYRLFETDGVKTANVTSARDESPQAPPVVILTVPRSGAMDVDPSLTEVRVTFSKPMKPRRSAWVDVGNGPLPGPPGTRFLDGGLTCVRPVKLEPGKTYAIWINHEKYPGFQDTEERPAVPYLLIFRTKE